MWHSYLKHNIKKKKLLWLWVNKSWNLYLKLQTLIRSIHVIFFFDFDSKVWQLPPCSTVDFLKMAYIFYGARNFRRRDFRRRNFSEWNFRGTEFSLNGNFAERNFRWTELSPLKFLPNGSFAEKVHRSQVYRLDVKLMKTNKVWT